MRGKPGDTGIAAALGIGGEAETEFRACVLQGIEIPDLSLDGGEVGHGWFDGIGGSWWLVAGGDG
jgi:hypothetical protein